MLYRIEMKKLLMTVHEVLQYLVCALELMLIYLLFLDVVALDLYPSYLKVRIRRAQVYESLEKFEEALKGQ